MDIDKSGTITLDEYVRSLSKNNQMKRIAVSLFSFLDKNGDGEITFEELLSKITPGSTKEDVDKLMRWIHEE